jgi:DNA-binding MarR family transcriptional regulator
VTDLFARRRTNLGRLLFRGYRAINVGLLEQLRAQGHSQLRLGHVAVLSNLDLSGGTRLVVIAERAGVTKQAIGPVARELESLGYVSTAADPSDGRAKLVSLTSAGRQVIEHAQPIIDRIESEVRNNLGPAGFETLVELLNNLLDDFDEGDAYPER